MNQPKPTILITDPKLLPPTEDGVWRTDVRATNAATIPVVTSYGGRSLANL